MVLLGFACSQGPANRRRRQPLRVRVISPHPMNPYNTLTDKLRRFAAGAPAGTPNRIGKILGARAGRIDVRYRENKRWQASRISTPESASNSILRCLSATRRSSPKKSARHFPRSRTRRSFSKKKMPAPVHRHFDPRDVLREWNGKTRFNVRICANSMRDLARASRLLDLPGVTLHRYPRNHHHVALPRAPGMPAAATQAGKLGPRRRHRAGTADFDIRWRSQRNAGRSETTAMAQSKA